MPRTRSKLKFSQAEKDAFRQAIDDMTKLARSKNVFKEGQKVKFVAGCFAGKTGIVQMLLPSGRVCVKINGKGPDANGRSSKLGSTFAEQNELQSV